MTKIHIVGRLYEMDGSSFLVKVPLVITTIPEVPDVITLGSRIYALATSNPLQYNRVTSKKAMVIKK